MDKFFGDPMFSNILYGARAKTVDEYWKTTTELRGYARMFNREVSYRFTISSALTLIFVGLGKI